MFLSKMQKNIDQKMLLTHSTGPKEKYANYDNSVNASVGSERLKNPTPVRGLI